MFFWFTPEPWDKKCPTPRRRGTKNVPRHGGVGQKMSHGTFFVPRRGAWDKTVLGRSAPVRCKNCWEKLVALKSILKDEYLPNAIYEEVYYLVNGKEISRIYVPLQQKVSIHNKNTWRDVMEFFNEKIKWAHIDIAGTCWTDKNNGINPSGATGFGVKTLVQWIKNK